MPFAPVKAGARNRVKSMQRVRAERFEQYMARTASQAARTASQKRSRDAPGSSTAPIEIGDNEEVDEFAEAEVDEFDEVNECDAYPWYSQENSHPQAAAFAAIKAEASQAAAAKAEAKAAKAQAAAAELAAATVKAKAAAADEALLKQLECPVCISTMMPPIKQCLNGHTICATCAATVDKCPECRADGRPSIRNLALEKMASELAVPCEHVGCKARIKYGEMTEHVKQCQYRPLACPWSGCSHVLCALTPEAVLAHLRTAHNAATGEVNDRGVITIPFQTSRSGQGVLTWKPYIIKAHGKYYVLNVSRTAEVYKCSIRGIGATGWIEYSLLDKRGTSGNSGSTLSMKTPIHDMIQCRTIHPIGPFVVPIAFAHWMSGTLAAERQELCLSVRALIPDYEPPSHSPL